MTTKELPLLNQQKSVFSHSYKQQRKILIDSKYERLNQNDIFTTSSMG